MTDNQLALVLHQLSERLRRDVSSVQYQLSQPILTREARNFLGGVSVEYPILDDLWETVHDLDKSIAQLEKGTAHG